MSNKLLKNTILYSLGTIIPQIAAFILLPIYTRYLSPSEYGILNSVQVIVSILTVVYTLAIDKAIYRLYFDFPTEKGKRDYLGTIFISVTTSVVLITSILFLFPQILGQIYKGIKFYPYIAIGVLISALSSFAIIPRTVFLVKEKANRFILISLAEFFLRNTFIVIYVVFLSKGIKGYLNGQLLGSALLVPVFLIITFKNVNLTFIKSALAESLKYSLPMLPTMLSVWVFSASDRVFIERYFGTHDVGIYSLGYKIAMLVTVVSGAFYKAYNPFYFRVATTEEKENAIPKLKRTNTVYVLAVILASSLIALFAKEGIALLFERPYHSAYKIVTIVSLGFAISGFSGIFNLAIYQEKKTKFLMYVNIAAAIVNIILNYLLISNYGAYGAAWATTFTYLLLTIFTFYYAKKCYYPSFNHKMVFVVFVSLLALNLFFYFINLSILFSMILKMFLVLIISYIIWVLYKNDILIIINKKD